jgi:hypothetical protein
LNRLLPTVAIACALVSACAPNRHTNVLVNGNVINGAGGNVIAAGGGNVVSAGGGNLAASSAAKAPGAATNTYGIPTAIRLPMPAALNGAGVVAAGSANVVAAGSANVVAAGSANYRLLAVPTPDELAGRVYDSVGLVNGPARLIEDMLRAAVALKLKPGVTVTGKDPKDASRNLAVLLEKKTGRSVLSIGIGTQATGAGQVIGLSFTSARKGRAVFHSEKPGEPKVYLAYEFDLDAGKASSQLAMDTTNQPVGQRMIVGRMSFSRDAATAAPFGLAGAFFFHQPELEAQDGVIGFAANFLDNGQGAYIFGAANAVANQNRFGFLARGGTKFDPDSTAPHDFYMTESGADLPKLDASSALRAIVPADDAIPRPFPLSPLEADPFEAEHFDFPE